MKPPISDSAEPSIYGRPVNHHARRLGCSPATLYRQIRKRGLPATLVGGSWFIRDEDLHRFFAARTAARLKKPAPIDQKAHDAADRALTTEGW
jgi:excisionase family DNA binding protein